MSGEELHAVVPITEALPELRAEEYADVCEWDDARMRLAAGYEAADGEYLAKIQARLAPAGLFSSYLEARGLPRQVAYDRIHKATGHIVTKQTSTEHVHASLPEHGVEPLPAPGPAFTRPPLAPASYRPAPWSDPVDDVDDSEPDDWSPAWRPTPSMPTITRSPDAPSDAPAGPVGLYESEALHVMAQAVRDAPETRARPVYRILEQLSHVRVEDYLNITDDALDAWVETVEREEAERDLETLERVAEWCARIRDAITARRRGGVSLRVMRAPSAQGE